MCNSDPEYVRCECGEKLLFPRGKQFGCMNCKREYIILEFDNGEKVFELRKTFAKIIVGKVK